MVLNTPITFPPDIPVEFKDLVASLLEKDPELRIGWPDLALHPFIDVDEGEATFDEGVISDDGEEVVQRLDSGVVVGWEKVDETLKAERYAFNLSNCIYSETASRPQSERSLKTSTIIGKSFEKEEESEDEFVDPMNSKSGYVYLDLN